MIYRYTRGSPITLETVERRSIWSLRWRSVIERGGCARGAVVGHSGVPSLVAARLVLSLLSVRPSVRSSRRLLERGEGSGKIRMDARIGGLLAAIEGGRDRSFCLSPPLGKRANQFFERKKRETVARLSRIPGRGTDCFRFCVRNGRKERGMDKSGAFADPEAGNPVQG